MIENHPSNVASAFEMLLEEVETEIDFVTGVGARAFEKRDYDMVREAHERAESLTAFRDRIAAMGAEWDDMAAAAEQEEDEDIQAERRAYGKRLRKGARTPEKDYYRPILQTLEKMGGRGKVAEVLERVGVLMKSVLKPVDYEPLASDQDNPRWRNAAQWARNNMVNNGLLESGSPRGWWEISDKGRAYLKQHPS